MDAKKLIDALRVCADDDIICPACERYRKECDGSYIGLAGLMLKAAELLESQCKRIERLAYIINTFNDNTCGKCDYTRDNDMRCMCDKSQWAGRTVRVDNYCGYFEPRNEPLTLDELILHLSKRHPHEIEPLYIVFDPPMPVDYAPRWRDAYNLSSLVAHDAESYGKRWMAYWRKPKED